MARRRASMREGPLAELFRATEAAQRQAERGETAGDTPPQPPAEEPPVTPHEETVEHVPTFERAPAPAPPPVTPPPGPVDEPARSSKVLPVAIVAVGGVALAGGIGMIALGGPPASKTQQFYTNYRTPGYAVAAGGVVAVGVGLYLLLRPDAQSAPTAAVSSGGAVFGWTGQF